jgi:hypothetical protein
MASLYTSLLPYGPMTPGNTHETLTAIATRHLADQPDLHLLTSNIYLPGPAFLFSIHPHPVSIQHAAVHHVISLLGSRRRVHSRRGPSSDHPSALQGASDEDHQGDTLGAAWYEPLNLWRVSREDADCSLVDCCMLSNVERKMEYIEKLKAREVIADSTDKANEQH